MSDQGDLWAARSLRRWRLLAALSALVMFAVLAHAPTKEYLRPWRAVQAAYNEQATRRGVAPIDVHVRQVWLPDAARADRCGTCHLGAAGATALEGAAPFGPHPSVPHAPAEVGCTYCHSGQGAATNASDAHGTDGRWPHPILPARHVQAGCAACHQGLDLPLPEVVEDADELVAEFGCETCHDGATTASLSGVALRGVASRWVERHHGLRLPADGIRLLATADDDERAVLKAWLKTRVGAPRLARGKMVFHALGCMGCHRRGPVGGDVGPDLSAVGDKDVRTLVPDAASVPDSYPRWLREHLLAPAELVPGSRMPPLDPEALERPGDLDDLTTYLLSLRDIQVPEALTPPDRARVRFGLGRDFPSDGRGLYVTFCSGCHGSEGGGAELESLALTTPMIGTRGFLSMVTPRFIRDTLRLGRRSRFMPAFGSDGADLSDAELDRLVDYLWSLRSASKPYRPPSAVADAARGTRIFEERCAFCHAEGQDGLTFGGDLRARGALSAFSDETLWSAIQGGWVEAGMPSFAFLPGQDLDDLIAHLRAASGPPDQLDQPTAVAADTGRAHLGLSVYASRCASCHGARGEGGAAPILNSAPYLGWASDGYLAARTRSHRDAGAREAVGALSDSDLAALLGHVRIWSGDVRPARSPAPTRAAFDRGHALYPSRCGQCHGPQGVGRTGPSLRDPGLSAIVSRAFIVMTIAEGRRGTAMAAWRKVTDQPVDLQGAFDLADYVLGLSQPPTETASQPANGTTGERR